MDSYPFVITKRICKLNNDLLRFLLNLSIDISYNKNHDDDDEKQAMFACKPLPKEDFSFYNYTFIYK